MKYVFLDTCVIVDCAFTRKEKTSPKLLERLLEQLDDNGAKLLLPEVVQLELEKVLPQTMDMAVSSLKSVENSVEEVAAKSLLSHSSKDKILDAVSSARKELKKDVKDALDLIKNVSNDPERCTVLPLVQEDLVSAVKTSIKGNKPSKPKAAWGLIQEDCLIVGALERFIKDEPGAEMAICSSNTADFTMKASNGKGNILHDQIACRLGDCRFYSDPVDLMDDEAFIHGGDEAISDKEMLKSSYEATSQAIKTMNQNSTDSLEVALRTLAELNLPKKYPDMPEQLSSVLRHFNLVVDSVGKNSDIVLQNQTGVLSLLDKVIAASRADQIGRIHSASDDVGYDEADKEDIEDDVE